MSSSMKKKKKKKSKGKKKKSTTLTEEQMKSLKKHEGSYQSYVPTAASSKATKMPGATPLVRQAIPSLYENTVNIRPNNTAINSALATAYGILPPNDVKLGGQDDGASSTITLRQAVENRQGQSPVYQCRATIFDMDQGLAFATAPYGFQLIFKGEQGTDSMAAGVRSKGNEKTRINKITPLGQFALQPYPNILALNHKKYVIDCRKWKLTNSWITGLPLVWGADMRTTTIAPIHCEHKLPLFWLWFFGCGMATKLRWSSSYPTNKGAQDALLKSANIPPSVRPDARRAMKSTTTAAYASNFETDAEHHTRGMDQSRKTNIDFINVKTTVREECYAWEFPCINSQIKSQIVFINLVVGPNRQLVYVIARQAISNMLNYMATGFTKGKFVKGKGQGPEIPKCLEEWERIIINILDNRGDVKKAIRKKWLKDNIGDPFGVHRAKHNKASIPRIIRDYIENFMKEKTQSGGDLWNTGKKKSSSSSSSSSGFLPYVKGEGVLALVNACLSDHQKELIGGTYNKNYIYNNIVSQLIKLVALLNTTVNDVCGIKNTAGKTIEDSGIRNNLNLNYERCYRYLQVFSGNALGATAGTENGVPVWNDPAGVLKCLREINKNATKNAALNWLARVKNANRQSPDNTQMTNIINQRGGMFGGLVIESDQKTTSSSASVNLADTKFVEEFENSVSLEGNTEEGNSEMEKIDIEVDNLALQSGYDGGNEMTGTEEESSRDGFSSEGWSPKKPSSSSSSIVRSTSNTTSGKLLWNRPALVQQDREELNRQSRQQSLMHRRPPLHPHQMLGLEAGDELQRQLQPQPALKGTTTDQQPQPALKGTSTFPQLLTPEKQKSWARRWEASEGGRDADWAMGTPSGYDADNSPAKSSPMKKPPIKKRRTSGSDDDDEDNNLVKQDSLFGYTGDIDQRFSQSQPESQNPFLLSQVSEVGDDDDDDDIEMAQKKGGKRTRKKRRKKKKTRRKRKYNKKTKGRKRRRKKRTRRK